MAKSFIEMQEKKDPAEKFFISSLRETGISLSHRFEQVVYFKG